MCVRSLRPAPCSKVFFASTELVVEFSAYLVVIGLVPPNIHREAEQMSPRAEKRFSDREENSDFIRFNLLPSHNLFEIRYFLRDIKILRFPVQFPEPDGLQEGLYYFLLSRVRAYRSLQLKRASFKRRTRGTPPARNEYDRLCRS